MVASAFISPLFLALALLLAPFNVTLEGEDYVKDFAANIDSYGGPGYWLTGISAFTLIPAIFAVSKVARWGKRTLGLVGMILAFILAIPIQGNTDDVTYAALKSGLDVPTTAKLADTYNTDLPSSALGWSFLLALIGLILLGVAALIGKSAPAWAAIALIVAPVLVPIAWIASLGNVAAGAAWLVLAVGMGGVALSLLKEPPALNEPAAE
jgi:hypothetical protein